MNESDGSQDQLDLQSPYRQAIDARTDGLYDKVVLELNKTIKPPQLDTLLQQVKDYYWLAYAHHHEGEYQNAIDTYEKLIELTSRSDYKAKLEADNPSLFYIAEAFIHLIECKRFLGLDVNALLNQVAEGLNWLKEVKRPNWSAGLYLQHGRLLKCQGRLEEARQKLQEALVFARECTDAPGYIFATYQLELADLLCDTGFHSNAIDLAEEVLATVDSIPSDRQRAYKILVYAQLEKGVMTAVHSPTLKDRPLDAAIKSTGAVDNQILKELQSIKEQLAQLTTTLYPFSSASPASNQQSTAQATQSEKATNEQTGQSRNSEFEQYTDLARFVYEQARDYIKLLQEQSSIQVNLNTTVANANQIISTAEQLKKLMGGQLNPPGETAMPQNVPPHDSSNVKSDGKETCSEHITCLVALPSDEKLPSGEKDDNFHKVVLPALRQVLELHPYYWQVVCEDQMYFKNIQQLNVLEWLKRAQAYIVDITNGNAKVLIELGSMLHAKKPDQPLLLLKREDSTQNLTGILDGNYFMNYPKPAGNNYDVDNTANKLKEQFEHQNDLIKLNERKEAHYLSPLYVSEVCGVDEGVAEKLCDKFATIEAFLSVPNEEYYQRAQAANVPPKMAEGIKATIIDELEKSGIIDKLKESGLHIEGGKHDEQPPKPN